LYFVFVYFLKIGSDIPHWPVALLLGIVLWNFFAEVTNNGVTSIVNRGDIIRKINFPKYVIVIAGTISAFINLLLNLAVIAVFMIINGIDLTWLAVLSPIYIVEIFVFALGLAFILGSVFVKIRDINYIWEIIMQGLFYASAVIYPIAMVIEKSETAAKILLLNPVAQAIQDIRYVLINQDHTPTLLTLSGNWLIMLIPLGIVAVTFIFGAFYFKKKSPSFAENL
jgi:ABC-2 type transport system permease protein